VDARQGLQQQTFRHAALASWLGVPRIVLAVNKMDLVDGDRARFEALREEFSRFAGRLGFRELRAIPLSALRGDMVVERGELLGWYDGPTLLQYLETAPARHDDAAARSTALRFPVQRVARVALGNAQPGVALEGGAFRGYQGTIASGHLRVGAEVIAWPSGRSARVAGILTADGPIDEAGPDRSVTLRLDREIDLSRGDLLASADVAPRLSREVDAEICWFDPEPLAPGRVYLLKHGTATVKARIERIAWRLDVRTLERVESDGPLSMNDVAHVRLLTQQPLALDAYRDNRVTGAFILIDEATNRTLAAGTIGDAGPERLAA